MNIKSILFFIILFLTCNYAGRATEPQYRPFDKSELEDFRNDDEFKYERPKPPSRFEAWEWIAEKFRELMKAIFGAAPSGKTMLNLLYIIAAVVMLWVIAKLVGVDVGGVFKTSKPKAVQSYEINEENLQNIDFDKEMQAARSAGQLRLLIRLQYLFVLKGLSDKGIIEVKGGKTNHDYLYEIGEDPLRPSVASLSRIFEYTWYGNFEVHPEILTEADRLFGNLKMKLG